MKVKDKKTLGHLICLIMSVLFPPLGAVYGLLLVVKWFRLSKYYTEKYRLREYKYNKWIKEHIGVR